MSARKKSIIFVLVVALLGFYLQHNRWWFYDTWRLHGYTPPTAVVQLADQTTMTPYARHLFYVYHPELQASAEFNKNCRVTKAAVVLGCTVNLQGIYLYNIKDPQLDGIRQVTAAYEMLHVGYSRLSSSQRTHIDSLVQQAYDSAKKTDPALETEAQSYLKTEGQGAVANELHSMMGAEVVSLPPELETYYKQYFTNRPAILALKNQYQSVFAQRRQVVADDDAQLTTWQQTIEANEKVIKDSNQHLIEQKTTMNQQLAAGQAAAYNAQVPTYNAAVNQLNSLIRQTQALITLYNQKVQDRNAAALQVDQLTQTISSQPLNNLTPGQATN